MELQCLEKFTENKAYVDPVLLENKVFKNLLKCENSYVVDRIDIQQDITLDMKKIVIAWMKEVTEEQKCQVEVFLLSVNYMNRFLNVCQIKRNQLQLLGTACMLIASKLRESNPLTAKLLIFYTDNSVTLCELLLFEQLVLSKLKWDIAAVTPLDFLQHIILKISLKSVGVSASEVDERAKALISYCACEHEFWHLPPRMVAATCIIQALGQCRNLHNLHILCKDIYTITGINAVCLEENSKCLKDMVVKAMRTMAGETEQVDYQATSDSRKNEFTAPPLTDKSLEIETATTPTDVYKIDF